ncbi:hypothetical protein DFH06DRAFT_429112 [Mycena polygramma]|nr:hypothetical protein DFH06DRAFT_429112 [Mycena polygramma]
MGVLGIVGNTCHSIDKIECTLSQPAALAGSPSSKRHWWEDLEETSSDSESDYKRARIRSLSPISRGSSIGLHRLPRSGDDFLKFCSRPGTVFVDKTHCILGLPPKFQHLLTRPPRFGKTSFLSTLYHYYDIRGEKYFTRCFGSLAVAKASEHVPTHSQHLCLSFDLSHLSTCPDPTDITSGLIGRVSGTLSTFLDKYAAELHVSDPDNYLDYETETSDMFRMVFNLVGEHGFTLFVGVDNYDASTRPRSSTDRKLFGDSFTTPHDIELVLDSEFWLPLLAGTHVIDKLLVIGSLPVKSPALRNLSASPALQAACGFTEQETIDLVRPLLDKSPDMVDLHHSCGDYSFSSQESEGGMTESFLHPQLLFNRVGALSIHPPHADEDPFRLLSTILSLVPEQSDVPGAVAIIDLICLLAAGAVEIKGELDTFHALKAITWSTLYDAGALTYDRRLAGALRVVNNAVLSLLHSRLDTFFADRYGLARAFPDAWYRYHILGNPRPLLRSMSEILRDLAQRSFGERREVDLRGIFELVMRNPSCVASSRAPGPLSLLPADVVRVEIPAYRPGDQMLVWELKTVSLRGMWQATNLNDDEPTAEALEILHKELVKLDEKALLARPYRVWSPERNAMETVLVGSFFDPELEVPQFLAVGGARILMHQRDICQPEPEEDEAEDECIWLGL